MRFLFRAVTAMAATLFAGSFTLPALADESHLPIVTISPLSTFTNAGNAYGAPGTAIPLVNGQVEIVGSATIPIVKGISVSFDHSAGGLIFGTFGAVAGAQLGSYRDHVNTYRLDSALGKSFNIEAGLQHRHRLCCPGSADPNQVASTEWHQGYLGLTYTTPNFGKALNYSELIVNVSGHTANHNPSAAYLATTIPGQDIGHKREYGMSQSATLVLPLSLKSHLTGTATYANGALDYFENLPFPLRYQIWNFGIDEAINPYVGFQMHAENLWQAKQGSPFPTPEAIHIADFTAQLDFHLNFNKIFAAPKS